MNNKIFSYIGFAIRSKEIIYGGDNILKAKKNAKIILVDNKINRTTKSRLTKYAQENNIQLYTLVDEELSKYVCRDNIKAIAIKNINLAEAIKQLLREGENE